MTTSHLFYLSRNRRPRVDRAEGIYFWDQQGKRYLDGAGCTAAVTHLGHGDEKVVAALTMCLDPSKDFTRIAQRRGSLGTPPREGMFHRSGNGSPIWHALRVDNQ